MSERQATFAVPVKIIREHPNGAVGVLLPGSVALTLWKKDLIHLGGDQETNDLMALAYKQGKDDANTITPEEARERFPGYGEDVA